MMQTLTAILALLATSCAADKAQPTIDTDEGNATLAERSCSPGSNTGYLWLNGVNIAGFEFGTDTNGYADLSRAYPPTGGDNPNGYGQVQHFFSSRNMNAFRYPVSWQYLINSNTASTDINMAHFGNYNGLIQQCLKLSPNTRCIVDIHNYGRFEGNVLSSSDPWFSNFWASLAGMWKDDPNRDRIIFELMNEPHDIDMDGWTALQQEAVIKIRNTMGTNNNIILLSGTDWTHASNWVNLNTGLAEIKNPGGEQYQNLLFTVHDYFQGDNADPNAACDGTLQSTSSDLACWLRQNERQAMFTEIGGGRNCVGACMSSLHWLAQNSDVFIGYTAWAAGSFDTSYIMSATPDPDWSDRTMVRLCYQNGPQYNS
ncbi:hypothetical protein DL771_003232 [Monosporascus sp. 5C6A]|nr:hypothetical protein DL771_003232 [Monosporascus sp. 5C6A]